MKLRLRVPAFDRALPAQAKRIFFDESLDGMAKTNYCAAPQRRGSIVLLTYPPLHCRSVVG